MNERAANYGTELLIGPNPPVILAPAEIVGVQIGIFAHVDYVARCATITLDCPTMNGAVRGTVRWAQAGKFGLKFDYQFDLGRLAPKKEKRAPTTAPKYFGQRAVG